MKNCYAVKSIELAETHVCFLDFTLIMLQSSEGVRKTIAQLNKFRFKISHAQETLQCLTTSLKWKIKC